MTDSNVAQRFAVTFVDELARAGLRHVCLAPGSRSAALAMAFARHQGIRVWTHIDERCAAFFALGIAKASGRPAAVLCTSGTAAAELHAAVIEAHHSRTPLLVLTADRPPELRDVGANQAIDQNRLYGSAVRWYFDPGVPEDGHEAGRLWRRLAGRGLAECMGRPAGPVHLNLPFREPLTGEPGADVAPEPPAGDPVRVERGRATAPPEMVERVASALRGARRPLLVAGEMRDGDRLTRPLSELLTRLEAPVLAEPTSQLRRRSLPGLVVCYDAMLRDPDWAGAHAPDVVVRLGAPPTSKPLGQHLLRYSEHVIAVDPDGGWRDPDHLAAEMLEVDPASLVEQVADKVEGGGSRRWRDAWLQASHRAGPALAARLATSAMHEGHVVQALAGVLTDRATVFAGSSMAIRDVDTFWPATEPGVRFLANRGASGIDGLVSAGLGVAAVSEAAAVLLIGDLSLYHDMNGLLAAARHDLRAVIVVLDNNGGGIFDFLPQAQHKDVFEEVFATPLNLRLDDVARLYDLDFCRVTRPEGLPAAMEHALGAGRTSLVCATFERAASVAGHSECWRAVRQALSSD